MADAALSFAIENVGNFLIREGKFLSGVRGQVEEMQKELKWMRCFLEDAETRKGESNMIRNWVLEIRGAAYDVEDLIERFVIKSALRDRKGVVNRMKKYVFFINQVVELHQVRSGIEAIKAKLSNLRTSLQTYGIRELRAGGEEAPVINRRKRQDYAHVVDQNVVGLDEKIDELVGRLLDVEEGNDHRPASVVCLYGMGGLGKTTAAKKVYGDTRIRAHFEGFAWVYVSQQCNPRQVWESILSQLSDNKEVVKSMSEDQLASQLCRLQKEKKCLLVIDDIWSSQDWHKLSAAFPYLEKDSRSKILLTSRNQSVASHGVYRTSLDILDHGTSMELLRSTILFLGGPNHPLRENSSMDMSAWEMVKKCGGLPLAIIVLGGILASKHELKEWKRVDDNIKLNLRRGGQKGNDGVTGVLELSYEDLPYNLKSCFLYFSQYLEDEEIKTTELVQKWIGEGFISSSVEEGDETMEDVAEEYLNELVSRCMIQVGKRGHTGRVKTCRMHDLVLDLCISKAKEEGFAHSVKLGIENEGAKWEKASFRRLCIFSGEYTYRRGGTILSSLLEISPQLRSIWFHLSDYDLDDDQGKAAVLIIKNLKSVRVLAIESVLRAKYFVKTESTQIGNPIHLRFLKLKISQLPTSICNSRFLQTLNLEHHYDGQVKIPDSLWGMEQLRHLYLPWSGGVCESSKQRVCNFRNLQTLVNFPPEKFDLQQNLVKFTHVRKLVIFRWWEKARKIIRSQEIVFNRLQSLSLEYSDERVNLEAMSRATPCLYRLVITEPIEFPAVATPIWPSNLTKLVLRNSGLDQIHMEPLAKLQSLKVLFLESEAFIGKEMIFHKNDFPQLHHLSLYCLEDLETWAVHEGALPNLFCLEIDHCRKLRSVPDGSQFLKQLKELNVKYMPYSFIKRLIHGGEDWDRTSHVPSVSFINCDQEPEE